MDELGLDPEWVAAQLLESIGVAAIWDFHVAAAAAYRNGCMMTARSFTEVADAAERQWLRSQEGRSSA